MADPVSPGTGDSVPGIERFGPVEPDEKALREAKAYSKGTEQRREQRKQAAHWISLFVLRLFAICLCIVFLVRIYHLIAPRCWYWLDDNQLQTVDYLLFSGVIGGVIGSNLKQIFGAEE